MKILLSRKDHEVYFLAPPHGIKRRRVSVYVEEALHECHPGFSPSSVYDVQKVSVNGRPWLMVTVMERETLAEYRLRPHARLFTTTGILIRRRGFSQRGMTVLPDETIGYDAANNLPVSIPVMEAARNQTADISSLLKKTPGRCGVFLKRRSPLLYALLLVPALAAGGSFLAPRQGPPPEEPVVVTPEPEIPAPNPYTPGPLPMLVELAGAIQEAGGTIDLWRYDETSEPVLAVQVSGVEADTIYDVITAIPYAFLYEISDISYTGGIPRYTARLSRNTAAYRVPEPRGFTTQEAALRLFSLLRERFLLIDAAIVSESPPSPAPGKNAGALSLEVKGRDLTVALETIGESFAEHELGIPIMTVSLDSLSGIFMVSCSFMPYQDAPPFSPVKMNETIPAAFGYVEKKAPVAAVVQPAPQPPPAPEKPPFTPIGVIKDEENTTVTYYKNPEGKIVIEEEPGP